MFASTVSEALDFSMEHESRRVGGGMCMCVPVCVNVSLCCWLA